MACVAVSSLLKTLELEFLQPQPRPIVKDFKLIFGNGELIRSLRQKLEFFMEQLDKQRIHGVEAIKHLETDLRDVAFRVEDEIEFLIAHLYEENTHHLRHRFRQTFLQAMGKPNPCLKLHRILQQAKAYLNHIEEELVKVKNEFNHTIDLQGRNTTLDSSQQASHFGDIMVGKADEFRAIKRLLIEHPSKQREVVSIKGMGGIGKTTLARAIYKDSSVAFHFDKRAWIVVSQFYNKRKMLIGLLKSILKDINVENCTDGDLTEKLYQGLKRRRYLVVLDDVWSGDSWDAIKACFPNDGNCSRVLLTTRLEEVANYISVNNDFSHRMHLLDGGESWTLFHKKVLSEGVHHNAEFELIGRPIVEKCGGLPLAIVVVAGLFSKLKTLHDWKSIAKALSSPASTTILEACSRILSLSYKHLPNNLKACFLYLGVFPEDEQIYANDLARLWAAEGLVKTFENESSEVVAQRYIRELVNRNLILLSKQSSCGRKIKAFRMHDILHAFCVREAQSESLLHIVKENGNIFSKKCFRWLSIQSSNLDGIGLDPYSKNCRSIFYFPRYKAPKLDLRDFNILRVLHVANMKQKPLIFSTFVHPIHLRYLSSSIVENLDSQSSAWNLQTLCATRKPLGFMSSLGFPHLCYFHCNDWSYLPKFVHQNLEGISRLNLYDCKKELFAHIPCVKKISIAYGGSNTLSCIRRIGNLAYLPQLESLKIFVHEGCFNYPINNQIALMRNLKKLSFWYTNFRWEEINILSSLPRLEVIKLGHRACIGQKWELREEEIFCKLVFLEFGWHDFEVWEVSDDHFPNLERLILNNCYRLKEIPSNFEDIPTLKSIELKSCLPSAVNSAKQIQEKQHEYGNNNMVAIVE